MGPQGKSRGPPKEKLGGVCIFVDNGKVVGPFSAKPEDPYFVDRIQDGNVYPNSITWREETLNTATPVSYFIPMLPGTYVNPKLYYYDENRDPATDEVQLTGTLTIERGKVTQLPVQEVILN